MERLTGYNKYGTVYAIGMGVKNNEKIINTALARLAAYEDTGLEPQEVKDMAENAETRLLAWSGYRYGFPVGKLMDLLDAESEGRLVVLPCKEGDTVYTIIHPYKGAELPKVLEGVVTKAMVAIRVLFDTRKINGCRDYPPDVFGKTVFLTREEAEEALRRDSDA